MTFVSIIDQINFFSDNLKNENDAYNLYKGFYANELIKSLEDKNLHNFFLLEDLGFRKIIKKFETQRHYNRCLKIFDEILDLFFKKNIYKIKKSKSLKKKVAFLIHNTSVFLAHIELFFHFLQNIEKEKFLEYQVDIFTSTPLDNINLRIRQFCKIFNINIFSFTSENDYIYYEKIINFYSQKKYKNLIFLSVVKGMSYISKSLPGNVSWFVFRFLLDSFKSLKHIYAPSQNIKLNLVENTKIFYFKNFVTLETQLINCIYRNNKIKFYTLNREEKIKNIKFLNYVREILYKFPQSTFSWTGREKNEFVENFFKKQNLDQRVFFLGWIDIDKHGIKHGDVFLDVPVTSGLLAAKCFASGIPTVFFNNSSFWLNNYKDNLKIDKLSNLAEKEIISDWYKTTENSSNYLNITTKLVTNENYFKNYVNLSIKLAKKYFTSLDSKNDANSLFENMFS
jgi:hypothetical protein